MRRRAVRAFENSEKRMRDATASMAARPSGVAAHTMNG
jgi:hypothetical protein